MSIGFCPSAKKGGILKELIPDEYVMRVCKPGSEETCRYLLLGPKGWTCGKMDPGAKNTLDLRVASGMMKAKGDNCIGIGNITGVA